MKIRNGFVSNSSSSSFIMISVDSTLVKTPYSKDLGIEDLFISEYPELEVTGFILADTDEELTDGNLSVQEINRKAEYLVTNLNIDFSMVKLYYGERLA